MTELLALAAFALALGAYVRTQRIERELRELGRGLPGGAERGSALAAGQPAAPGEQPGPATPPSGPAAASAAARAGDATPTHAGTGGDGAAAASGAEHRPTPPDPAPPGAAEAAGAPAWGRAGLEQSLAGRLPVWLGSAALLLAAAYLVKFSFDRELLSPAVRVGAGLLFGAGLVAAGELLRRPAGLRIAAGLSAAGVGALYAALLAAVNLYQLVGPVAGFVGLALTTAAAVGLSLRQGMVVALLGLVGGFATPALIEARDPQTAGLFAYLFLLEAALVVLSVRRGWWTVAKLTLLGGLGWAGAFVAAAELGDADSLVLALFLAGTAALFVFASGASAVRRGAEGAPGWLGWVGAGAALSGVAALVGRAGFDPVEWSFLGLLGAGALVLGRLDSRYQALAPLAAALCAALLLVWGAAGAPDARFGATAAGLGTLFAMGSWALHRGAVQPGFWTGLAAGAAAVFLLLAWAFVDVPPFERFFGVAALALAAAFGAAAAHAWRREVAAGAPEPGAAAGLAVGAAVQVALAAAMELERPWVAIAWSAVAAASAWGGTRLGLPALHRTAGALAAGVGVRLLADPRVLEWPLGPTPLWNDLLWGYGAPALALAAGGEAARRGGAGRLADGLQGLAVALGAALLAFEIRHAFHGTLDASFELLEWGVVSSVGMAYALALLAAAGRWPRRALHTGGRAVLAATLTQAVLAQGLFANPLWARGAVGTTPVWNGLLLLYGLPALGAGAAARMLRGPRDARLALGAAAVGLLLLFALVTTQVRQAFHGSLLAVGGSTPAEIYAYSIAWVLLGTGLLVAGIATRGAAVRWGSLAIMLLAVAKVFLYDTAELRDLYRVFSLLGLGVSLLLLAWLYQRFVFRTSGAEPGP